jgi:hypothetical protein
MRARTHACGSQEIIERPPVAGAPREGRLDRATAAGPGEGKGGRRERRRDGSSRWIFSG